MIILLLTDLHGKQKPLGKDVLSRADLILVAGDITHFGGREDAEAILDSLLPDDIPAFLVPGNCDGPEVSQVLEERNLSLDGKVRLFEGIHLFGMGGSLPSPGSTPREKSEEDFQKSFEELRSLGSLKGGILVCHQPPYRTKVDMAMRLHHVGSRAVRRFIEETGPLLCVSGHIHESSGQDTLGNTSLVNPGPYRHGSYALCEIRGNEVSCTLKQA
ncbi:MAG: metallophosphoesterase [Spirochaetales bacterium]|nr:metallophosphoesterase [Spirochaetales bacterium]